MKRLGGYVLDSTYMNASDPNSMRDAGMTRNAVYVAQIGNPVQSATRTPKRSAYDRFIIPTAKNDNTTYSFGGKTSFNKARA